MALTINRFIWLPVLELQTCPAQDLSSNALNKVTWCLTGSYKLMVASVHNSGTWETKGVRCFKKPKGRGATRCLVSVCGTAAPQPAQKKQHYHFQLSASALHTLSYPSVKPHTKAHPNISTTHLFCIRTTLEKKKMINMFCFYFSGIFRQ